jgi:hypothetical protein
MLRILLLIISLFLSSLTLVERTSATVTYTPGSMIAMTWSNTSVRFDVASILVSEWSSEIVPTLMTTTLRFTGTFYASDIGWIVFASGSSQVSLDCGGQPLSNLISDCTLTGTGWSENVGDIDFAGIVYHPTTGLLSGSAITFAWDISLTGIALPLIPVELDQTSLVAHHAATLTTKNAWIYDGGNTGWVGWIVAGIDSQSIAGNKWTYIVDLSLAGIYTITIRDTNDSKTKISGFVVNPDILTTTTTTALSYHAAIFCTSNPMDSINCPDGATRNTTSLTQLPITTVVANGSDAYTLILRARDQYGNRVDSGVMQITYTTTVKNVQTNPLNGTDNPNYWPSNDGDAFISDKVSTGFFWTSDTTLNLTPTDITYTISSTAPTNPNNEIALKSIRYNGTDITLAWWRVPLTFVPLFVASIDAGSTAPIINTPHIFQTNMTKNGTTTITPTVITTMQIGDGSIAEWRSLTSSPLAVCSNYPLTISMSPLCDWSGVSSIVTSSVSSFGYTGTYTTWLPDATGESTTMTGYIYYNNGISDILYVTDSNITDAASPASQRITILGQSWEWVSGGARNRVDLINSIREQTHLLSRNRMSYDDIDYLVVNGDYRVSSNTIFDGGTGIKAKRTIIVLGGDIYIDVDIALRDHPIALIALTDSAGNGWDIKIEWDVGDIHSSLIAEHAIISGRSDLQLYIHGSLVSANPPHEIAPTGCPYFAPAGCTRSDYDLPGSRDTYAALLDKTLSQSASGSIYPSPLVIEWDPRIIRDPAPMMSK